MGALDCMTSGKITATESKEVFTINVSNSSLNETRRDLESQLSNSSTSNRPSLWWNVAIDLPILVCVSIIAGLYELGVLPGYKAGFFCKDPSLSYPFTGDTVSMGTLISVVLLLPIFVILVTELLFLESDYSLRTRFGRAIKTTLWLYRNYSYGLFLNFAVMEIMKLTAGSPRPNFFDICQPDTGKTCNGSEYVATFKCTSENFSQWYQNDASRSFPSGHTSFSVYCGLFSVWYLQRRAFDWRNRTVFLVPLVQVLSLLFAAIASLTRITDHKHHSWDVLAGTVIGVVCLLYTTLILCDNFSYASPKYASSDNGQSAPLFDVRRRVVET